MAVFGGFSANLVRLVWVLFLGPGRNQPANNVLPGYTEPAVLFESCEPWSKLLVRALYRGYMVSCKLGVLTVAHVSHGQDS